MTDDDSTAENPLDHDQMTRAAGLAIARQTLMDTGGGPFSNSEAIPKRFGTQDLIDMAAWLVDGADPLAGYREESAKRIVVVRVPNDQVEAVSALNQVPSEDFPNGLLIVPESVQRIKFPVADAAGSEGGGCA
jgi:hypothetical protein